MKRILCLSLLACSLFTLISVQRLAAQEQKKDWDDLFEEDRRIYGSEKEEKYAINAFFVEKEEWEGHDSLMILWFFRKTDYPRYRSFRLFPFYYSIHSKIDNRRRYITPLLYNHTNGPETKWITPLNGTVIHTWREGGETRRRVTWWAPLVPLTWHHVSPEGGHRNYLGLLDYSWRNKNKKETLDRFWFVPLLFWSSGREGSSYLHILPPLYMSGKEDDGGSFRHVLPPLYMTWQNVLSYHGERGSEGRLIRNDLKMREHSYSLLWGSVRDRQYHKDGKSDITASSFWFPLLPLFYRSKDEDKSTHYNVLWLLDWGGDSGNVNKRFWAAPLYFGKGGDNGYRHIIPPLYLSGWEKNSYESSSYRYVLPPLFFSGRKKSDYEESSYRHVLTPLYFSGRTESKVEDRTYHHVLPPLYMSWRKKEWYSGNHDSKKDALHTDRLIILSPLGGYARKQSEMTGNEDTLHWKYLWFPIIPLYFSGLNDDDETHRNLLWLADWKKDDEGKLERFWLIPLIFYGGSDGYRACVPFYFRSGENTEDDGWSAGLLHYHGWSKESRTIWSWPFYSWKDKEKDRYYRHFLPVYYSWKLKGSSGSIILPLSISYETKYRSIHLNATGFSRSMTMGPFNPSVFPAKYRGKWFLDMDFSWLYNVFSISTRMAIENPFKGKDVPDAAYDDITAKETDVGKNGNKAALHKKKTFDRENSESFWGMKLLFGWFAIEKGDTKRHVRLIPLSWLTWDEASDDRIYVVPPLFMYYNSTIDNLRYLVVFPFYGSQRQDQSYARAYLLNLFWDEYDDTEKRHEKTVLWPLVNWYDSPARSGWRVMPLVWYRETLKDGDRTRRYISPLFYHRSIHGEDTGTLKYRLSLNPLFYHKKTADAGSEYSTLKIPLLPLMSFTTEKYYSYDTPRVAVKGSPQKTVPGLPVLSGTREYGYSWFFPFYYYSRNSSTTVTTGLEEKESMLVGLPFLYRDSYRRSEGNNGENEKNITSRMSRFFLMGYYREREDERIKNSFLFGLYSTEKDRKSRESSYSLLYGLMRGYQSPEESSTWLLPVYSYRRNREMRRVTALAGTFIYSRYNEKGDSSIYLGWGMGALGTFHEDQYVFVKGESGSVPVANRRHWFMPLYFQRTITGEEKNMSYARSIHWNPLWYADREKQRIGENEKNYSRFWFPIAPLYYRYSDNEEVHWNALFLLDHTYSRNEAYRRTLLFPLFYHRNDNGARHVNILGLADWQRSGTGALDYSMVLPLYVWVPGHESNLVIPPLLGWFIRSPEEKRTFLLGTYWRRSEYGSRQNLLYLFDHEYVKRSGENTYDFLFGMGQYQTGPEATHSELLLGLLLDYTNYRNRPDYEFDLGMFLVTAQRRGAIKSNSVFPLWYYKGESDRWKFFSIAGLTYLSKNSDGDRDYVLGPLLYYRNNKAREWKDRRMLLLGTLWNEVKKPARKYHARGMFWGILWDYETEEETGFKKFSILKGLYKETRYKGEVKRRFFWIF